jgi:hypothetical protein
VAAHGASRIGFIDVSSTDASNGCGLAFADRENLAVTMAIGNPARHKFTPELSRWRLGRQAQKRTCNHWMAGVTALKNSHFEEGFIGSAEQTENVAPSGRGTFDKTPKNETAGSQTMGIEWTAAFSRQSCSVGAEVLELT